ncbi:MAG TPA: hypothetical protein VFV59_10790 [Candidatus Limnocylindria bacterium]|nr:hypothetical protein [Candidatus Limnocylindria bacterium]
MSVSQRRVLRATAIAAAALLATAAAWNLLFQVRIVTPPLPSADNAHYYAWWRPIEWQTFAIALLAAAGLGGVGVVGLSLRGAAGAVLGIGAIAAMVAQLAQAGAQHAILAASTSAIDPGVLGTIGFVADGIVNGVSIGAYAGMALGVVGLAVSGEDALPGHAAGRLTGALLGAGLVALSVFSLADPLDLLQPVLGIVGMVLTPAWLWQVGASLSASGARAGDRAPVAGAA